MLFDGFQSKLKFQKSPCIVHYSNLDELLNFDIDYLVLNAGLNRDNIFLRMSPEDWNSVINVNLNSSFYLLKHFTKKMVKKRFGRIVFISSVVAHIGTDKTWCNAIYSNISCR